MTVLSHDLLIVKLEVYGSDVGSANFLLNYLGLRKHRTKVGSSYSKWSEICRGITQGSVLGPLLFIILIKDIFYFVEESEICNFNNDNAIFITYDWLHIDGNNIFMRKGSS